MQNKFITSKKNFYNIYKFLYNVFLIYIPSLFLLFLCSSAYTKATVDPAVYIKAYPEHIQAVQNNQLIWKDGTTMPIKIYTEPRPFEEALKEPDLYSQIMIPYPLGPLKHPPLPNSDPGRIRYVPFFQKMYGAKKEEVQKNLVEIDWMPRTFKDPSKSQDASKIKLWVTKVNHVDEIMRKISRELDDLVARKPEYKKFLENPGGTFSWRLIAGTDRPSAHSFGMTIDINVKYSAYWLWDYKRTRGLSLDAKIDESQIPLKTIPSYRNEIPWEIVAIFEKHHYIWGGKWFHFDTMHFEYRPELFEH